jgi:hypothetical protein
MEQFWSPLSLKMGETADGHFIQVPCLLTEDVHLETKCSTTEV